MLYFIAEDHYYYEEEQITKLKEQYALKDIIALPDINTIRINMSNGDCYGFIAPYAPSEIHRGFKNNSFFELVYLKNYFFPFTKEQIERECDQDKILSEKLGIKITTPKLSFKDYGGSGVKLIDEAKKIELRFLFDLKPKGFFIVGIPGTGKSFFAKCFAGETGRKLVEFNISKIKEDPFPMLKIEMILSYFKNTPGKYLLWIDEMEKQFADDSTTDILGVLLTELNEFQSGVSNVFFIATANNINKIATDFPEMLRPGGRFDKLIFLLPSTDDATSSLFSINVREKEKHFKTEIISAAFIKAIYKDEILIAKNTRIDKIADFINEHVSSTTSVTEALKKETLPIVHLYSGKTDLLTNEFLSKHFNQGKDKAQQILDLKERYINKVFSQEDVYRFLIETTKNYLLNNSSYALSSIVIKIVEAFGFKLPIEETKAYISLQYRDSVVEKSRFPYTPSEINNLVNVIYTEYYLSSENKYAQVGENDSSLQNNTLVGEMGAIIMDMVNNNIPIQKQFNQGISIMASQGENFLQI